MTEYTRKQKHIIDNAWDTLLETASNQSWRMEAELKEALRTEKRHRSSLTAAKGLLLQCLSEENLKPSKSVGQLFGYSAGCRFAAILGAYILDEQQRGQTQWERVAQLAAIAGAAHNEAIMSALRHLKEGTK